MEQKQTGLDFTRSTQLCKQMKGEVSIELVRPALEFKKEGVGEGEGRGGGGGTHKGNCPEHSRKPLNCE